MHFPRHIILFKCCILLFITPAFAQTEEQPSIELLQCPINTIDRIALPDKSKTASKDSFIISSKHTSISNNEIAKFTGGVTLVNQDQVITAQELEFNRLSALINATGNIQYQNQEMNIFANGLTASEESKSTTLHDASYQLMDNPGHGSAEDFVITNNGSLHLYNSTYTTCYGEVPDWQLVASEINILPQQNKGEAYHARFKVMDVPILYLPYFSFPIEQKRKSGLLYPEIGSSSNNGVEIMTPYYWNIAENYDATITPHYMSKRGLQLQTEFRYLTGEQTGIIDVEYLQKDNDLKNNNDPRYLARWQHTGSFADRYRAFVDYTTISDENYLVDINSTHYNANDAYLYQIGELSYFADTWQSTVKLQDFEVLGNHIQSYKTMPQIELASYQELPWQQMRFDMYSEISSFQSNDEWLPTANRYHAEAGFTLPIVKPAWFLNSEVKVMHTYYQQDNISINSPLEESVTRTLPKVRIHGGINLDRPITIKDLAYTQTLEPQLQYLYVPDKDQSAIGIYDTASLQEDYDGLFRDKRFSGLDRIAQANQYSWGITSRLLNASNIELFHFSVGRIVYLNETNILTDGQLESVDKSALASDLFLRLNNQWQFTSNIQYNPETEETKTGQANLDYQYDKDHVVQLNHRYSRDVSGTTLEQVSLLTSARINPEWQFIGRVTQDLQLKRSLETYAGFQYESCCWAVRFAFHRHINSNLDEADFDNENRDEFDTGFMIQFVIKGLSSNESSVGIQDMFNSSIFGYKRPYFLNN